ncbi:MAG: MerR family transcriptional regulator [Nitrospirae bacterium]|jgi:DNA-binding transcriptional MerR regulator|nr:MerR family transcriptional regulator [Nitrospirota bacterium]MBI5097184.1 MerR family transcriptional regulator [Nitrospirota bacterium]
MKKPVVMKLFYKISEVSKITGLESYVLRYWETEFPMLAPRKNRGGQRVYEQKDIDAVLKIKKMLYEEGFTIAGARKRLQEQTNNNPAVIQKVVDELKVVLTMLK